MCTRARVCLCVCAHRRLTDGLISANGIISKKLAGQIRYMDNTYVSATHV